MLNIDDIKVQRRCKEHSNKIQLDDELIDYGDEVSIFGTVYQE